MLKVYNIYFHYATHCPPRPSHTVSAALRRRTDSPDFSPLQKRNFLAGVIQKMQKAGLAGRFWLRQNKRWGYNHALRWK
jgi:hypothetical protein